MKLKPGPGYVAAEQDGPDGPANRPGVCIHGMAIVEGSTVTEGHEGPRTVQIVIEGHVGPTPVFVPLDDDDLANLAKLAVELGRIRGRIN